MYGGMLLLNHSLFCVVWGKSPYLEIKVIYESCPSQNNKPATNQFSLVDHFRSDPQKLHLRGQKAWLLDRKCCVPWDFQVTQSRRSLSANAWSDWWRIFHTGGYGGEVFGAISDTCGSRVDGLGVQRRIGAQCTCKGPLTRTLWWCLTWRRP